MDAMSGNSDKIERKRHPGWEIFDALVYTGLSVYVGWVAWSQSASLAAPTTAICTAVLLMPRVSTGIETLAEQWRRPLMAVGTILTGFLWLLSTVQPDTEVLPSNPSPRDYCVAWLVDGYKHDRCSAICGCVPVVR